MKVIRSIRKQITNFKGFVDKVNGDVIISQSTTHGSFIHHRSTRRRIISERLQRINDDNDATIAHSPSLVINLHFQEAASFITLPPSTTTARFVNGTTRDEVLSPFQRHLLVDRIG
uniref:Uncharacterized protein n=1 Tax=Angiostrongylus cantonensis TaxID=6313 RepID=A0A0K0DAJ7_ANGCA